MVSWKAKFQEVFKQSWLFSLEVLYLFTPIQALKPDHVKGVALLHSPMEELSVLITIPQPSNRDF